MVEKSQVFIKIDDYKDILDIMNLVKSKIQQGRTVLNKLNELKNQEDEELETWSTELGDIEKKVEFIDSTLFEPEE